jgi:hypothetical protein
MNTAASAPQSHCPDSTPPSPAPESRSPALEQTENSVEPQPDDLRSQITGKSLVLKRLEDIRADTFGIVLELHGPRGKTAVDIPPPAASRDSSDFAYDGAAPRDESPPVDLAFLTSSSISAAQISPAMPASLSAPKAQKPSSRNTRVKIKLQEGFEWNRESLALLYKLKDKEKRGSRFAIESGAFPGHTPQSIDLVWKARRAEARTAYEVVYAGNKTKRG